jgi:C1A family cysteine protease
MQQEYAVALVGNTADRFIVRNSWGKLWGNDGFGFASLGYAQEAFTEAYRMTL